MFRGSKLNIVFELSRKPLMLVALLFLESSRDVTPELLCSCSVMVAMKLPQGNTIIIICTASA